MNNERNEDEEIDELSDNTTIDHVVKRIDIQER